MKGARWTGFNVVFTSAFRAWSRITALSALDLYRTLFSASFVERTLVIALTIAIASGCPAKYGYLLAAVIMMIMPYRRVLVTIFL